MSTTRRHVEPALVMPQSRCKDASTTLGRPHLQLRWSVEGMTDEFPVDKVGRTIDGNTGKVLKGRGCDVVSSICENDGWVWVEAAEDRVAIGHDEAMLRRSMTGVLI